MNKFSKKIVLLSKNRFIIFMTCLVIFALSYYFHSGSFLPSADTKDLWFYSGLFMVLFSMLFIEPYYSSPKNVITNATPLLLVFLAIKSSFINQTFWWVALTFLLAIIFLSVLAMAIEDKNNSPEYFKNRISNILKRFVVTVGTGRILYSCVFVYFLLSYYSIQDRYTLVLFIFWFLVLLINPKNIHNNFSSAFKEKDANQLGEIFGIQSKKIFLVKLFEDRKRISKFDLVKFRYSMQDTNDLIIQGIVFDTYLLNQEKWAKVMQLATPKAEDRNLEKNIVYKISDPEQIKQLSREMNIEKFVGVVIGGSTIGKIKFEYSKKNDDLQEGDLLELRVGSKRLFYQVINGTTAEEKLEARNETGFIEGDAIQLGEWQNRNLSFQKFGWVPAINTPIFMATTEDIEKELQPFDYPDYKLGLIPGTLLPSVINLKDAVSHHMALLGVTGSGKSFIAREIIKELAKDIKVICVDLTGEWKDGLSEFKPEQLIDPAGLAIVEEKIAQKESSKGNKSAVLSYKKEIHDKLNEYIQKFAESKNNITVFELPDLSNTSFVLEFTQMFLEGVFIYAKKNQDKNFCIVLEEAHTIIPETSFLGDLGDYSSNKGLVSKMGQIALQGRKYGVGFLVIAQRTANVSKTVLTQCNTVICFQAFDETSFNFLGNYVGKDMVQALPNLKQYHAIVAGKAMKSNMPMIIDLKR